MINRLTDLFVANGLTMSLYNFIILKDNPTSKKALVNF